MRDAEGGHNGTSPTLVGGEFRVQGGGGGGTGTLTDATALKAVDRQQQ
jgi:hypothetical protein